MGVPGPTTTGGRTIVERRPRSVCRCMTACSAAILPRAYRARPEGLGSQPTSSDSTGAEQSGPRYKAAVEDTLHDGEAEAGKASYATCATCHGTDGKGNQQLNAPGLVDLPDWYMLTQLHKFKSGVRGANPNDVTGAQMAPMATTLKDEQAMKDVIAHIKTL